MPEQITPEYFSTTPEQVTELILACESLIARVNKRDDTHAFFTEAFVDHDPVSPVFEPSFAEFPHTSTVASYTHNTLVSAECRRGKITQDDTVTCLEVSLIRHSMFSFGLTLPSVVKYELSAPDAELQKIVDFSGVNLLWSTKLKVAIASTEGRDDVLHTALKAEYARRESKRKLFRGPDDDYTRMIVHRVESSIQEEEMGLHVTPSAETAALIQHVNMLSR